MESNVGSQETNDETRRIGNYRDEGLNALYKDNSPAAKNDQSFGQSMKPFKENVFSKVVDDNVTLFKNDQTYLGLNVQFQDKGKSKSTATDPIQAKLNESYAKNLMKSDQVPDNG